MNPCNVCGGTDMNLVDGYYYCVECGTQDVNVQETVVEQTMMGDGTFALTTSKKFTTVKDKIEMSSEWHKWHIFNFILVGLTDELITLGAKPSLKMKVLWIWSRYVRKFQVKDDLQAKYTLDIDAEDDKFEVEGDTANDKENSNDNSDNESKNQKSMKSKSVKIVRNIETITRGTILTILYVALNLDRSDIQLSHLFRFISEGRLSLYDCTKYVPKELKVKAVTNWKSFVFSLIEYNPISIRELSLTCFKILKLGVPLVPDLRKIVRNFIQELCLPSDVQDLVFALMHFMPIDFLHIDAKIQKSLVRIPDYEGICMAYILVALKMCFGLDDDYEARLSREVDKINYEENNLKSYKGLSSESSDRLFSFKEWCEHLQFRKYILCKNYLPMSRQFNSQKDNFIIEHLEKRRRRGEVKLSDDVTMDILNKIKSNEESQIIPKADFPVTLTPMSTYMDVIGQHVRDPDLKLLLCEDFTQYSLSYAIKDFALPGYFRDKDNLVVGVSESGKIFNKYVVGTLTVQEGDMTMVYVRNCQNKNWLKTKAPKVCHVTKIGPNVNGSDKESDHGYNSNTENSNPESDSAHSTISDERVSKEIIDDIDANECIFDDNFLDISAVAFNNRHNTIKAESVDDFSDANSQPNLSMQHSNIASMAKHENDQESEAIAMRFDPNVFDRSKIIKELIELACVKYKISIPKENTIKRQNKRKMNLPDNDTAVSEPKKKRIVNRVKPGEAQRAIDNLISAYYNSLHNDILNQVSQQLKSIIEDVDNKNNLDSTDVLDCQNRVNEHNTTSGENDVSNVNVSHFEGQENEKPHIEFDTNNNGSENSSVVIHSDEQNRESLTREENMEDAILHELFPKSDPKFDEKEHDIRQLYVKLGEDIAKISISDISNDPEIDKIIQKQIEQYTNIDKSSFDQNKMDVVTEDIYDASDSDDDVPLSVLKETTWFEQEKEESKKHKLEPLIRNASKVATFKYWIRHYKSNYVVKSKDVGKKFDLELNENLPMSFLFVIRECSAILGCSMFSIYKNMQNIEEILIANMDNAREI